MTDQLKVLWDDDIGVEEFKRLGKYEANKDSELELISRNVKNIK